MFSYCTNHCVTDWNFLFMVCACWKCFYKKQYVLVMCFLRQLTDMEKYGCRFKLMMLQAATIVEICWCRFLVRGDIDDVFDLIEYFLDGFGSITFLITIALFSSVFISNTNLLLYLLYCMVLYYTLPIIAVISSNLPNWLASLIKLPVCDKCFQY